VEQVNKNGWFWLAPQYFNQWRVFPRAFIVFYFWLTFETAMWFMGLPTPGPAQAAFASAVIGAGAAWFGLYVNSGPQPMNFYQDTSKGVTATGDFDTMPGAYKPEAEVHYHNHPPERRKHVKVEPPMIDDDEEAKG